MNRLDFLIRRRCAPGFKGTVRQAAEAAAKPVPYRLYCLGSLPYIKNKLIRYVKRQAAP